MKYLYKIWQTENSDYDTYDSAVVVAIDMEQARRIHPRRSVLKDFEFSNGCATWVSDPYKVRVKQIGIADESLEAGTVICASFNAG